MNRFSLGVLVGVLCSALVLSPSPVTAAVGDNLSSAFAVLSEWLGIGEETSVPGDEDFSTASLVEKVNYLEGMNRDLVSDISDLKEIVSNIDTNTTSVKYSISSVANNGVDITEPTYDVTADKYTAVAKSNLARYTFTDPASGKLFYLVNYNPVTDELIMRMHDCIGTYSQNSTEMLYTDDVMVNRMEAIPKKGILAFLENDTNHVYAPKNVNWLGITPVQDLNKANLEYLLNVRGGLVLLVVVVTLLIIIIIGVVEQMGILWVSAFSMPIQLLMHL